MLDINDRKEKLKNDIEKLTEITNERMEQLKPIK